MLIEGLSTSDIPKLNPKVIDAIKPEVIKEMTVKQLQVRQLDRETILWHLFNQ